MSSAAGWWPNHACRDEVSETIVRCVDRRQSGDGATPIGDDHFFTGLDAIDVLAETILQIADPHLRPGSSYIHDSSVATQTIRSTDRFGGRGAPDLSEPVGHDPLRAGGRTRRSHRPPRRRGPTRTGSRSPRAAPTRRPHSPLTTNRGRTEEVREDLRWLNPGTTGNATPSTALAHEEVNPERSPRTGPRHRHRPRRRPCKRASDLE